MARHHSASRCLVTAALRARTFWIIVSIETRRDYLMFPASIFTPAISLISVLRPMFGRDGLSQLNNESGAASLESFVLR